MRIFSTLFLILIGITVAAQKKYSDRKINGYHNGGYLTLNVLSLADVLLPTIQPGFEYKFSSRLGVEGAIGIPIKYIARDQRTDSTFYNYYKLRGTLRYYIYQNSGYLGVECFYTHVHNTHYGYVYTVTRNGPFYTSDFVESKKSVAGLDAKYAWIFRIARKFYIENFIGIGIRVVTIALPVNVNPMLAPDFRYGHYHLENNVVGTKVDPHLTLGLQLVYRL